MLRSTWQIAKTVLIEAIRRKELYVVVGLAMGLIAFVMTLDFFALDGLFKFYREVSLNVMSTATALTVIVLAARQLPREFQARTVYPLLARPLTRPTFLLGKLVGVVLAAVFCLLLFMTVYVLATWFMGGTVPWVMFGEYLYLQLMMMLVLATMSFWLSMVVNLDAAVTMGVLFYFLGSTFSSLMVSFYDLAGPVVRAVLTIMNYLVPQLMVFDLTNKTVHAEVWSPVPLAILLGLTVYGLAFASAFFAMTALCFRRRAL